MHSRKQKRKQERQQTKQVVAANLPKREQQVLDLVYALKQASVREVQAQLPDSPSYSATRMLLQRLHKKQLLTVEMEGAKYIYLPRTSAIDAGRAAFTRVLNTFFNDSPSQALSSLMHDEAIDADELAELEALLKAAKVKLSQRNQKRQS